MTDGFNEMPVRGKHLHNAQVPDETAVATLPALAGSVAPAYTEGNVVALSTDLTGNLRVVIAGSSGGATTVALDSASLTALESIDLNAATITAITSALESIDLNADTLAALESVDLNSATRDDIVSRLTTAITDQTTALSTNLESVSLNAGQVIDVTDRANRVLGTVAISNSQLEITNDSGNPIPVSGTVTITDGSGPLTVDGTVAVSNFPASQAVTGTVDLSSTSLAALEDINATVTGTVALDAGTLSALESVDLNSATVTALNAPRLLSVRGAEVADSNPLPVMLQENPGTTVDSGLLTQANVAPAGTATLASAAVGTGTGKLIEVTASSSVRIKVAIRANGSTRRVFFVDPISGPWAYSPKDRDLIFVATGNTFDVVITNMDNLRTADVYASIAHVEG